MFHLSILSRSGKLLPFRDTHSRSHVCSSVASVDQQDLESRSLIHVYGAHAVFNFRYLINVYVNTSAPCVTWEAVHTLLT